MYARRVVIISLRVMTKILVLIAGIAVVVAALFLGLRGLQDVAALVSDNQDKSTSRPVDEALSATQSRAEATAGAVGSVATAEFTSQSAVPPPTPPLVVTEATYEEEHNHVIRSYTTRLSPPLREVARFYRQDGAARFTMPLFDGREVTVVVDNFMEDGPDDGVVSGEVEGNEGSLVSLGFVGEAEAGTVQLPLTGEVYEIRPSPNGGVVISQIDATKLGTCGTCRPAGGP